MKVERNTLLDYTTFCKKHQKQPCILYIAAATISTKRCKLYIEASTFNFRFPTRGGLPRTELSLAPFAFWVPRILSSFVLNHRNVVISLLFFSSSGKLGSRGLVQWSFSSFLRLLHEDKIGSNEMANSTDFSGTLGYNRFREH
ncbi:hypothetical protein PanWU01x14_109820 [Parasponia andersonii]|uniref:Uncharacterized protein n=1 Tax=Parasponia andersonii TaxID=3476 RepID=A0A2P5CZS9_PARAD|nr:hypothetical protein PanWU01x14_109820 [Parasponia andersonii]